MQRKECEFREVSNYLTQFVPPSGRVWAKPDIRPRTRLRGFGLCLLQRMAIFSIIYEELN